MDLSAIESNDPAGLIAEAKIKAARQGTKNYERSLDQQGYQQSPGSISAADSGQFHIYRKNRRHEMERTKEFEEETENEKLDAAFKRQREERLWKSEEKTAKKKAKRQRRKEKKSALKNVPAKAASPEKPREPGSQGEKEEP